MLGSKQRFRHELEGHRALLYRLAYSWCHNAALADDLVQDTMLKALKNSDRLKNPSAIRGWLGKILTNCWYDHLRRTRETVDLDNLPYDESHAIHDAYEQQDIVNRVRAMIATLPVGQRQAITLVDLAGFSYIEIAEILDIPIGTVMSRISRARSTLRSRLSEGGAQHDIPHSRIRRVK